MKYGNGLIALATTLALTAVASTIHASPAELQLRTVKSRDGRTLEEVSRTLRFPNATLTCNSTLDGTNGVSGGELGLEFGRRPGTNGGWNLWSFFGWRLRSGLNRPQGCEPLLFQGVDLDGTTMGDMVWPASNTTGATDVVALRMIQESQDINWIYLRVGLASTGSVEYVTLSAYPGNPRSSVFPEEGERWVATRQETHCLSRSAFTAQPGTDVLVWYNVYAYENTGCAIVLNPEEFVSVSSSGDYGVGARLVPAPGLREVHLAIGQFTDEPASTWLPRFLSEQANAVRERLRNMNWNPQLPPEQFARQALLTDKLLIALGAEGNALRQEFEQIKKNYHQAEAASNTLAALAAMNALDTLNDQIAQAGLQSLN